MAKVPTQVPIDLDRKDGFKLVPRRPVIKPDITGSSIYRRLMRAAKQPSKPALSPLRVRHGWQRCVVKVKFNRPKASKTHPPRWVRHAEYISLENRTGLDPKVAGFDKQSDDGVDVRKAATEWHNAKDRRMFRIIISPENTDADLRKLTRDMMKNAEVQLGRELDWKAVIHLNTDHPHVHLILRGVANGSSLVLPREMICGGLSQLAREYLTQQLGHRPYVTLRSSQPQQVRQKLAREL